MMTIKDTTKKFGTMSKLLHWGVGLTVLGLFGLGYWMRTLDYYSAWYQKAPHIHESIGLLLFIFVPLMLLWRLKNKNPDDTALSPFERIAASLMKKILYLMVFAILITGYLISSSGDTPVKLFDWFSIPAFFTVNESKVFIGNLHQYFAYFLIGMVVLHALAAFKHHFIDKHDTLKRMLPFYKIKDDLNS